MQSKSERNLPRLVLMSDFNPEEFVTIPDGWSCKRLADCTIDGNISYGIVQPGKHVDDGVPVIRVNNVNNGQLELSGVLKVSPEIESKFKRTRLMGGEVLLTLVGSTGQSFVAPSKLRGWNVPRAIAVIRVNEAVGADWVNLCLQSKNTKHFLDVRANTTVQKTLNLKDVRDIPIIIPPKDTKEEIESTVFAFSKKIELLREQNKTLETLAQAIFKEWFVHFNYPDATGEMVDSLSACNAQAGELGEIPKGWRVGKLGEIAGIGSGKRPENKSEQKTESHCIPLIGATKIMGYVENHLYHEDIIVIGRVGTHGEIQRFSEKVWASDNTLVIKSDNLDFVYFILTGVDYEVMNRGAVQPLITQTDLKNYPVIVPSDDVMMQFNQCIKPTFEKVKSNNSQIQTLSKTRDTLLPKLMSGQVRAYE